MSLVTSLVTKKNFWILFPKITVGDIPEMLSIKVNLMYQNDQHKKIYLQGDFGNKTPTHMGAAHAISIVEQNLLYRTPRELNQSFYIPRISMIH